ncbi:MAG TPA: hypothetical protein VFF74_13045 [Methylophilaceae bacterium]|nr:hypothetical protein [Methylophilaceae bacterium]
MCSLYLYDIAALAAIVAIVWFVKRSVVWTALALFFAGVSIVVFTLLFAEKMGLGCPGTTSDCPTESSPPGKYVRCTNF